MGTFFIQFLRKRGGGKGKLPAWESQRFGPIESVGWLGWRSIESGEELFLLGNQNVYIACQESVPLVARISQVKPGRNGTSGLPAIA